MSVYEQLSDRMIEDLYLTLRDKAEQLSHIDARLDAVEREYFSRVAESADYWERTAHTLP